MRPIRRGESPRSVDFDDYKDAKKELVSRLGGYCSYCERPIHTNLAVEHIQPKSGANGHPSLRGRWSNFLLACVNCNSTKKDKSLNLDQTLLPDRDNTFLAYQYTPDGCVQTGDHLPPTVKAYAGNTLGLVGLDKPLESNLDSSGASVSLDRASQRMQVWAEAQNAKALLSHCETNNGALKEIITRLALAKGFFSVWMAVFSDKPDMKLRFIRAFKGTESSGCFDMTTGAPITPAPNPDRLENGGKL